MAIINRPEVAELIKGMTNDELEMCHKANVAIKCSHMDCDACPFNYCDDNPQTPNGYVGCIFADAYTELKIRKKHGEG